MIALELVHKTIEYCDYLETHLRNVKIAHEAVVKACEGLPWLTDSFKASLAEEVSFHDLSKFDPEEFVQYRRRFFKADFEAQVSIKSAWEHHKQHNTHHWENWTQTSTGDDFTWKVNCMHMIIDWTAMGYVFNDSAQAFYERVLAKDKHFTSEQVDFMYEVFNALSSASA